MTVNTLRIHSPFGSGTNPQPFAIRFQWVDERGVPQTNISAAVFGIGDYNPLTDRATHDIGELLNKLRDAQLENFRARLCQIQGQVNAGDSNEHGLLFLERSYPGIVQYADLLCLNVSGSEIEDGSIASKVHHIGFAGWMRDDSTWSQLEPIQLNNQRFYPPDADCVAFIALLKPPITGTAILHFVEPPVMEISDDGFATWTAWDYNDYYS